MRPASLLLALSLLACEGDPASTPPPSGPSPGNGSNGSDPAGTPTNQAPDLPGEQPAGVPVGDPLAPASFELVDASGDCAGLVPDRAPEPVVVRRDPAAGSCGAGVSDGTGSVAIAALREGGLATFQVYGPDGARRDAFDAEPGIVPTSSGWLGIDVRPHPAGGDPLVDHVAFGPDGRAGTRTTVSPDREARTSFRWDLSPDPEGGSFVVIRSTHLFGNHWSAVEAHRFDGGGAPRWPGGVPAGGDDSAMEPMFLGGGVSTRGEALLLAQDSAFLDATWFDRNGHDLAASDREERSDDVVGPGVEHDIDVLPLLDGSVAVRSNGTFRRAYAHLATTSAPLPAWLAERATSSFRFTRGNAGYAVFPPPGRPSADCTQRIELVSASGRVCGRVVLREEGSACTGGAVDQGWDGTVVQQSGRDACTYRFWPRLLAR
jgi:hypothetical protein